jgi:two-component system KDP operon response regulator KdpE
MLRILIIEKEQELADCVVDGLTLAWPECYVSTASGAAQALRLISFENPELVLMSLDAPLKDGFELCTEIRSRTCAPILVLSSRDDLDEKLQVFDLGADDFVLKPFNLLELLVRIRILSRRHRLVGPVTEGSTSHLSATRIDAGAVMLDFERHQAYVANKPLALTSTEFKLLTELVRHSGSVLSSQELLERVWGPQYTDSPHYLKVFVHRLRRKLDSKIKGWYAIQNEWGVGYRFVSVAPDP